MNLNIIKRSLAAFGINIDKILSEATPTIVEKLNEYLADIELADGESKGIVITSNGNNKYMIVKAKFSPNANEHMKCVEYQPLDTFINSLLSTIQNG